MITEERREQFHTDVAAMKLKTDVARGNGALRIVGIVLMVVGVVGALLVYNVSLNQDDLRDIGSSQILAVAMLALTVLGAALYLAAALVRVVRLWLLRQLVEGQSHADQIAEALGGRRL